MHVLVCAIHSKFPIKGYLQMSKNQAHWYLHDCFGHSGVVVRTYLDHTRQNVMVVYTYISTFTSRFSINTSMVDRSPTFLAARNSKYPLVLYSNICAP